MSKYARPGWDSSYSAPQITIVGFKGDRFATGKGRERKGRRTGEGEKGSEEA